MTSRLLGYLVLILAIASLAGCRVGAKDDDACNAADASPDCALKCTAAVPAAAAATDSSLSTQAAPVVARIVFVGKQQACECTRTRIAASRKALDTVLSAHGGLPVQTLLVDTEAELVTPYRKQQAFVVLPAIYFVDETGKVVQMLQGEVAEAQVVRILNPTGA
jgi:hypothetical protein